MKRFAAAAAILAVSGAAIADVGISEILINPPGGDNGFEFIELAGTPGMSLTNYWLLNFEGDYSASGQGGVLDQALSLTGLTLDASSGIFLWRDGNTVIDNDGNTAGTQGPGVSGTSLNVLDFSPDLENGSSTWALVTDFTGSVGTDYDVDNNNVLDSTPWSAIFSAVGFIEDDGPDNYSFASQCGGFQNEQAEFSPDTFMLGANGVGYFADVLGDAANGYFIDPLEIQPLIDNAGSYFLTPGVGNAVPAPGALTLAGLGLVVGARRRR